MQNITGKKNFLVKTQKLKSAPTGIRENIFFCLYVLYIICFLLKQDILILSYCRKREKKLIKKRL